MKPIRFIGVPIQCGCDRPGGEQAPNAFRKMCEEIVAEDYGDMPIPLPNEADKYAVSKQVKFLDIVVSATACLRGLVHDTHQQGMFPLIVGGDHSLALGSVAGSLLHDNNVGVIWFDAHGDINTEATSPSANAHGMPVAALMGLCSTALNEIAPVRLKPQNIFWVGARDLDTGEVDIINRLGISDNVYSADKVHQMGMAAVMQEITNKMRERKITNLHLSFDIDGMDPSIVAATGTKVPNGLTQEDFEQLAQGLRDSTISLMAMDFVEYNPLLDDAQQTTGKWCKDTLQRLIDMA